MGDRLEKGQRGSCSESALTSEDFGSAASELLPVHFQAHRRVSSMSLEPLRTSQVQLPSCNSAFRPYQLPQTDFDLQSRSESDTTGSSSASGGFESLESSRSSSPPRLLLRVTVVLLDTYQRVCSNFRYDNRNRPRRCLTHPNRGVYNFGFDNRDNDLIVYVNDILETPSGERYIVVDLFGAGTFGQVFKCFNERTGELVAVKVIKNQPAYYRQAWMEVYILDMLHKTHPPEEVQHIVKLLRYFVYRNHLCLVFESLSINLYELIKLNNFRGLGLELVRVFLVQILQTLVVLSDSSIIHCDLKPENILLTKRGSVDLKIIDFGSGCQENHVVYTYVQSRFYRSIEVLLGASYNSAIDMWSLGCIAGELFLGLPLFPGSSVFNMICRISEMLDVPPDHLVERSRNRGRFFTVRRDFMAGLGGKKYQLKSVEQYEMETGERVVWKRYFQQKKLKDIIMSYPIWRTNPPSQREIDLRRSFVDFLHGLLKVDPDERWTPLEALQHPFIKLEPLLNNEPWEPSGRLEQRKLLGHRARISSSTMMIQGTLSSSAPNPQFLDSREESFSQSGDDNEQSRVSQTNYHSMDEQTEEEVSIEGGKLESCSFEEHSKQATSTWVKNNSLQNTSEEWVAGTFMDDDEFGTTAETSTTSALDDDANDEQGTGSADHSESTDDKAESLGVQSSGECRGEFNLEASLDSLNMDVELSQRAPPPPPTAPSLGLELGTSAPAGSGLPASPFSVAWIRGSRSSSVAPGEMRTSKWLRARRGLAVERSDSFSNQMHSRET
ncbi:Serine/threonine-protein kinase ppk15 [Galdieria sulphuraria]|uniref:Dual-specificity tyrosine-(Y)-phosphorylation regulated kinase n=1 Tax=Galdieria sulphuraria TaxID=130081 RepID=M2XIS5_GALSU|nr:dual-specificity tyrosine-(Y)-phosphorylation regulated kinase [Galdieria sulphuraria]EME30002.1 dual-specificity tyrosine-(Y)-phosphorylation regulated kinase [Galdieria sulphuraria]GJD06213.1 Serine/threonine-protein kinase ppk15 [Galdieria sulphuraria]|eukprot:XP_005706522.1 dual-specificity tyrosine-(Y)-phosphorylation regulated kinase [Galdieria sulphuraria]